MLNILIIQIIGFLGWGVLVLSYYRKTVNQVLIFHLISSILFSIHYYLLGAYSGLFICLFEIVRDYLYYKTDKDDYIFGVSVVMFFLVAFFGVKNFIDLFPIVASIVDGYTLTKSRRIVTIGAIVSYSLWVIYNFFVGSISGLFTDSVIVVSNLFILLFNHDLFEYLKGGNKVLK